MFYRELMEAFPEAKVVLTVRDPERWYESVKHYDCGAYDDHSALALLAGAGDRGGN